jgi:hypothetical protein
MRNKRRPKAFPAQPSLRPFTLDVPPVSFGTDSYLNFWCKIKVHSRVTFDSLHVVINLRISDPTMTCVSHRFVSWDFFRPRTNQHQLPFFFLLWKQGMNPKIVVMNLFKIKILLRELRFQPFFKHHVVVRSWRVLFVVLCCYPEKNGGAGGPASSYLFCMHLRSSMVP